MSTQAYIDVDEKTLIFVPNDPLNRHFRMSLVGLLAVADFRTATATAIELERAEKARDALMQISIL